MPVLARFGLLVLTVGLLGDAAYHSLPLLLEPLFGSLGQRAHLVTFLGMLLVTSAVFRQGLAR